jgi:uncharacterized membrane protein
VRSSLWLVPLLGLLGGIGLSFATLAVDRAGDWRLIPGSLTGGTATAQSILTTIATSVVTLAGLVLTVTTVAVQLAMGQFSPRIVRALLTDRWNQVAIGLFGATFVYALLVLREVDDKTGRVPGVSVVVALVLMLASLAALYFYVHHASGALRASGLIDLVGDHSRVEFDRSYPDRAGGARAGDDVIPASEPGVVIKVDRDGLVDEASRADCVLELVPAMGDFVPKGAPLFRLRGGSVDGDAERMERLVVLGEERTHGDDAAYGIRKLVDIAERSIAQPFQDPTTTVQAIDRLHDLLRQLVTRPFPDGRFHDSHGQLRLITRTLSWEGYVRLAFDELRLAGAGSPQVTRRMRAALEDLRAIAPPERRPALDRQVERLQAAVARAYEDEEDARDALVPDQQGIGSGVDLLQGAG